MFCHLLFICSFVLFFCCFAICLFVCFVCTPFFLFCASVCLCLFLYFVCFCLFCFLLIVLFVCIFHFVFFFLLFLYVPSVHRNWFNNVFVIPAHQFLRPWNLELMLTDTRWEFHKYLLEILFWLEGLFLPYLQYCVLFHPQEIIVKAISAILFLLLKHYKMNHIYQVR